MPSPDWTEKDLALGSLRLHYRRSGGAGRAVVMAHGVTDAGPCFTAVADAFAAKGHDVVLYDARGHGESNLPEGENHGDALAADLLGLIRGLGLAAPIVVGHSMGANTAAQAAARDPEAIGALVLEDPPWFSAGPAAAAPRPRIDFAAWMAELRQLTLTELAERSRADNPGWPLDDHAPWATSKLQFNPAFFGDRLSLGDFRDVLPAVTCPTLLLYGDDAARGAIVSERCAREAEALAPSLQAILVPGTGHNIRRDNIDGYMAAVRAFLAGLSG